MAHKQKQQAIVGSNWRVVDVICDKYKSDPPHQIYDDETFPELARVRLAEVVCSRWPASHLIPKFAQVRGPLPYYPSLAPAF
eukprot:3713411-Rhodomonas_salina.1